MIFLKLSVIVRKKTISSLSIVIILESHPFFVRHKTYELDSIQNIKLLNIYLLQKSF